MANYTLAVLLFAFVALSVSHQSFDDFLSTYGKEYNAYERQVRERIYNENLQRIDELNTKMPSARFGTTKFADMPEDEFKKMYRNYKPSQKPADIGISNTIYTAPLPKSVDWTKKGAVTPVKNQGDCGSCWAFATSEGIESHWFLAGKGLPTLTVQQIVDCDVGNGDMGCSGGFPDKAYEYIEKAGGLESEDSYPYTGVGGTCMFDKSKVVAKIKGYEYVTKTHNETEMMSALAAKGPITICVDASPWQFYMGGVISAFCGQQLDHCVQITGYHDQKGWDFLDYKVWNVRNSWGADWGEAGYVWVERGRNLCGISDEATIPLI